MVEMTRGVINETGCVENNEGVLQERGDIDDDTAEIWKEQRRQSCLRTMCFSKEAAAL